MMASPFLQSVAGGAPAIWPTLPGSELPWLDTLRRQQLEDLLRDGLPGRRDEAWKYTALRALEQREYAMLEADSGAHDVDVSTMALPGVDGPLLVLVNGVFRADLSRLDDLPQGLTLQPLSHALREDPEPLRFLLTRGGQSTSDAFVRLNAALAGEGAVLRVAPGMQVSQPVHLLHVGLPTDTNRAWHLRHLIDVGEGASLDVVEHHAGPESHRNLATLVTDVTVRANARLNWLSLQNAAEGAVLVRRNRLQQESGSQVALHALEVGGALARHELSVDLRAANARLTTRGVFVPHGRQHHDNRLQIRHSAGDTTSDALWRGVADQRGRGVFHGAITVAEGADGSDARLSNKNLLLSSNAEIDTQPLLEIYADEVKAAHGATVGQLDERSLFYLRSRGIPFAQARALLTLAFCRAALEDLPNADLREHLYALLSAHLPIAEAVE